MPVRATILSSDWSLSCATSLNGRPALPETIPATVPGTVHLDLLAAGHLADPYLDLNEIRQDWVGWQDWTYQRKFDLDPGEATRHDLVFDGLDTFAAISLNGQPVANTKNMHRAYRFDISEMMTPTDNELRVVFTSPRKEGEQLIGDYAPRPNNYPGAANLMRKMACDFGWDWGPSMATSGIWKQCRIDSWSHARLASVRPEITVNGGTGAVKVRVEIERDGIDDSDIRVEVRITGVTTEAIIGAGNTQTMIDLVVPNPEVWWPHGLGAQPLYLLEVLLSADGELLDSWQREVGFRSVRLDTSADDIGSSFTLIINDVPLFVMGANWIPDDCFLPRVAPERYAARIDQAKAANINLLRVWGGGIYETDAFYQACDKAGMMVWQDFLFACAAYPEEGDLPAEIEAEARDNVARLMPYPSLVLWNGNNENIWGFFDWGWQEPLDGNSWGAGYYLEMLPKIVTEIDPTRPYWAGSPYSGSMDIHPNNPNHGCTHEWDVWNATGYEDYRNSVPRFMSEFGWQAPPTWATLTQSVHDDPLSPTSPGVWHHQKATIGNDKLIDGLKGHLPEPQNMDDWHYATQLNQARAINFGIEHYRANRPVCMGAIVWQLNDCWPVTSWAAIDGYGRLKPLWYALRQAYAPHLLTIQPCADEDRSEELVVVAVNERTLFWRAPVTLKRVRFDGTVLAEFECWRLGVDRLSAASLAVPIDIATPEKPRTEMIVATMQDCTAFWFFNEDINLDLPEPRADVSVTRDGDDWLVSVKAETFLRDLCLFVDRIHPDASVDEMLVNLMPGETKVFRVTSPVPVEAGIVGATPIFRCANQLAHCS